MSKFTITASLFKALMHPTRLAILDNLRSGEQCVCHLEAVLRQRQAYISQHLMVLREAGLVEDRREGARIFYRVVRPEVFTLLDGANQLSGEKGFHTGQVIVAGCPCPKCNPARQDEAQKG